MILKKRELVCTSLRFYTRSNSYAEMIKWIEKLPQKFLLKKKEFAHKYAFNLYKIREYKKSFNFLKQSRTNGIIFAELIELEVWFYEYYGDIPNAIKGQRELLEITTNPNLKIDYARLLFRNGEKEKLKMCKIQ